MKKKSSDKSSTSISVAPCVPFRHSLIEKTLLEIKKISSVSDRKSGYIDSASIEEIAISTTSDEDNAVRRIKIMQDIPKIALSERIVQRLKSKE